LDIKVYNSAGEVVAVLATNLSVPSYPSGVVAQAGGAFIPDLGQVGTFTLQGLSMTLAWDGTNSSGQFVASGAYTINVLITDQYGRVTTLSAVGQVLRQPVGYLVQVYNNAGELVRQWDLRDGNWRLALQGNGTVDQGGIALMALPNGAELVWDGTSALGQPVSQGIYILKVERDDGSGRTISTRQILLLRRGPQAAHKPYAAPNPVPASASAVVLFLGGLNPEGSVRAELYSLSGGLVANAALLSPASELKLPLGHSAAGIYIASVEWVSGQAVLERHLVKVAVLR
jgi:flagellar hook assembly protein FlgD